MATGAWDRTAAILAVVRNSNPFRTGEPVNPICLNPMRRRRRTRADRERESKDGWKLFDAAMVNLAGGN